MLYIVYQCNQQWLKGCRISTVTFVFPNNSLFLIFCVQYLLHLCQRMNNVTCTQSCQVSGYLSPPKGFLLHIKFHNDFLQCVLDQLLILRVKSSSELVYKFFDTSSSFLK
jgi:hypothetical protein